MTDTNALILNVIIPIFGKNYKLFSYEIVTCKKVCFKQTPIKKRR